MNLAFEGLMPTIRQLADDEVPEAARELVERIKTRENAFSESIRSRTSGAP